MVSTKAAEAVVIKDAERVGEAALAAFVATFVASSGELLSTTNWADEKVALISIIGAAASTAVAAGVVALKQALKTPAVPAQIVTEPPEPKEAPATPQS